MAPTEALKLSDQIKRDSEKEGITFSSQQLYYAGKLKEIEIMIKIKLN